MKRNIVRVLSLLAALAIVMSLVLLTGCKKKIAVQANEAFEFPYPEKINLSWWYTYDAETYTEDAYTTLADHPFFKRMEKKTNVHIDFIGYSEAVTDLNSKAAELQALMAAGECPDMVSQQYISVDKSGSTIDSYYDDEVYLILNDYIDVQMPNFNAMREEYSMIDKVIVTNLGNIMYIPMISSLKDTYYLNDTKQGGLIIRKDMLDEVQEDVPVTVDDWYRILSKIKTAGIAEVPLAIGNQHYGPYIDYDLFITCYDQTYGWCKNKETGDVMYGAVTDGMKEFASMVRDWKAEGILYTVDLSQAEKASDKAAAWTAGSATQIMELKALATNPDYEIVAAPDPVLHEGDKITYRSDWTPCGIASNNNIYLAYDCSQPAIACKWIDQFFTEEAYMESSYGVEGEDYTVDDNGNVTFTDKVLNHELGVRYGVEQAAFLGSFYHNPDVIVSVVYNEAASAACAVWSKATNENNICTTGALKFTDEEQEILNTLGDNYFNEVNFLKGFYNGSRDITEWDAYLEAMYANGLEERTAIMQTAYDRFMAS